MEKKKLIIIGLDGATFDLILPWVKNGKLKTFKKLLIDGTWGELASTRPPITGPAWSSFMTGKNPGKSGINDFLIQEEKQLRVINFCDILGETFWDTAGRAGKYSVVINVPVTYPAQILNGILLSGMMTPPGKSYWSNDKIIQDFQGAISDYIVDLDIMTLSSLNREKSLCKLYTMMEKRYELAVKIKNHYAFDLFIVVFKAPDIVCHRLWHKKDIILKVYEIIDGYLKSFINEKDNIFVMSDHGFGAFSKGIRINQYLYKLGALVRSKAEFDHGVTHGAADIEKLRFGKKADLIRRVARMPWKGFLKLGVTRNSVSNILNKMRLYNVVHHNLPPMLKRVLPVSQFIVDRAHSKAYLDSRRTRGIIINKNLYQNKEYYTFRDYIQQALLDLKDPDTGHRVIRNIFKKEEIYWGENVNQLPDLYIEPENEYLLRDDFGCNIIYKFPSLKANHCSNGIFMAYGPDILAKKQIKNMDITDIGPTTLHFLNAGVPKDMDGKVRKDIFRENCDAFSRAIKYTTPVQSNRIDGICLSNEEESAIKEGLRALGYID